MNPLTRSSTGARPRSGATASASRSIAVTRAPCSANQRVWRPAPQWTVKGGLGTGGRLGVQGGSTDASREVDQKAKKK